MDITYEVYVRHEVYQILTTIRGQSRDRILIFIESLASNPFAEGDYVDNDDSGREHQVKIMGEFALYYWPDHAEKEIRVVDLVDADRA